MPAEYNPKAGVSKAALQKVTDIMDRGSDHDKLKCVECAELLLACIFLHHLLGCMRHVTP